jgi:predicted RecB family endonuclease
MTNEEVAIKLAQVEERVEANTHHLEKLEAEHETLRELAGTMRVMAEKQSHMAESMDKLDAKVEVLESKPGKRWDSVVDTIVKLVVGAFIGYLLLKAGLPV